MRKNQASLTAVGIAMARAIESEKPAGLKQAYFSGINAARKVTGGYDIATGVV